MKKIILTSSITAFSAMGLFAQSKKTDSTATAKAEPHAIPYTLTHKDSVFIERAIIDAKSQTPNDLIAPMLRNAHSLNDVIDVEHEIK